MSWVTPAPNNCGLDSKKPGIMYRTSVAFVVGARKVKGGGGGGGGGNGMRAQQRN